MSEFVIDASAALAWLAPTQATDASTAFLRAHDEDRFVAPQIFSWEVGNALLGLHRRRVLSSAALNRAMADLAAFEIALQPVITPPEFGDLMSFAEDMELSLFDATYLRLAIEREAVLVSRDNRLLVVGQGQGVLCVDLRGEANR